MVGTDEPGIAVRFVYFDLNLWRIYVGNCGFIQIADTLREIWKDRWNCRNAGDREFAVG